MKNNSLILGIFALFILASCSSESDKEESKEEKEDTNTPEYVTEAYFNEINQMNFDEAKKYTDETTAQLLDLMKSMEGMIPEEEKEKTKSREITQVDCEEVNDGMTKCTCIFKEGEEQKTEMVDLKQVDGQWKIHMEKDSPEAPIENEESEDTLN